MTRDYTCCPGDHIPCPKCGAGGGPDGRTRVRGVLTDRQYNDRRCNKCGHLWTVGGTLELPLSGSEKPTEPAKPGSIAATEPPDYDFGDGFEREIDDIPF